MDNNTVDYNIPSKPISDLPPEYQNITFHMIFDVNMGKKFRGKSQFVAYGPNNKSPEATTYSSVVSRDSVQIAPKIAALNGLDVLACDIQNAYLMADCRERVWVVAGTEFGYEAGKNMLVRKTLYGSKISGVAFRAFLVENLDEMSYLPSYADPYLWLRPELKLDSFEYYEYILSYVDNVLCISNKPRKLMKMIQEDFKLKYDKI